MKRSGMFSATCSVTVHRGWTKLRNEFELAYKTPQLNKHGVGGWPLCCLLLLCQLTN